MLANPNVFSSFVKAKKNIEKFTACAEGGSENDILEMETLLNNDVK